MVNLKAVDRYFLVGRCVFCGALVVLVAVHTKFTQGDRMLAFALWYALRKNTRQVFNSSVQRLHQPKINLSRYGCRTRSVLWVGVYLIGVYFFGKCNHSVFNVNIRLVVHLYSVMYLLISLAHLSRFTFQE